MTTVATLWALYLGFAAILWGIARRLGRPLPGPIFVALVLLAPLLLLPAFTSEKTVVPVDHALALPPWSFAHPGASRYNHNLNDIAQQFVPWAKAVRMAVKEGALPHRNRWNGCGMVLAGNSQSSAFYPPLLLGFALPLAASFSLVAAIKLLLALAGTWLWLRELRVSAGGALFGAVAFGLSLTMTAWLLFPHTAVISLWPWALFAVELCRREDWRPGFWTATCVFLGWGLGGHPESAASGAAFAVVWLLARALLRDLPDTLRLLRRLAASAAAALGLSAFLLVPSALAILASNRLGYWGAFWAPHLSLSPHAPVWPAGLLTQLFPRIFGDTISSPMVQVRGGTASYPEMGLGYVGIAAWACALLILRVRGSRRPAAEIALLAPLLAGWGFGIGAWPFAELISVVPALKLMFPIRFFSWIALAAAALAAFEIDRLSEDLRARRRKGTVAAAVGVACGLGLLAFATFSRLRPLHVASGGIAGQLEWLLLSLAALAGFAVTAAWAARRTLPLAVALTMINGAELYLQGQRIYQFGSLHHLFPPTPAVRWLASRPRPFRVVGEAATIFPNSNVHAGVEEVRTHDPVERRDYVQFLDATAGYPVADYFKQLRNEDARVMDFLNVRYFIGLPGQEPPGTRWKLVYGGHDAVIYENPSVLPRVFVPATVRLVERPSSLSAVAPSNAIVAFEKVLPDLAALRDWGSVAYLAANGGAGAWREGPQPDGVTIGRYRERTNDATFEARNSGGRDAVVVASLVQDGGWSATAGQGQLLETAYANGPFLALRIPPGVHQVRLRYVPPGAVAGASAGGITVLALGILLWRSRRGRKRRSGGTSAAPLLGDSSGS